MTGRELCIADLYDMKNKKGSAEKLNVLFLIFSFHVGGIERQLVEMANAMAKQGNEVHLCVVNHSYDAQIFDTLNSAVQVVRLDRESKENVMPYMVRLLFYVRKMHIQVIHAQEPTGVVFSLLCKALCRTKIVETIHNVGEDKEYSDKQLRLADFICDKYVAISKTVEKEILTRGIAADRVEEIHNAVNLERFSCTRGDGDIPEPRECWNIANVARFYPPQKGQDILVRAMVKLRDEHPEITWHLFLAGAVYRGQEHAYDELQAFIRENGLSENITMCGNIDDVPGFLGKMHLFVLPSRYEGFGISLIESLAMGLPAVASRLDGPKEIMEGHPELGQLFESENIEDLASQIAYVIQHAKKYSSKLISEYIAENYGMEQLVTRHISLYHQLLE